jgi:hypothetical protein
MKARLLVLCSLLLLLAPLLLNWPLNAAQNLRSFGETADEIANYDVRTDESKAASAARAQLRLKLSSQQATRNAATVFSMRDAQAALQASVPTLQVLFSQATGTPEIVGTDLRGQAFLTAPSTHARELIVKGFLARNAALFGLSQRQIAELKNTGDYLNPAGNLGWLTLEQRLNNIPVFAGELRACLTPQGEVARLMNTLTAGINATELATTPNLEATQAIANAAETIGIKLNPATLKLTSKGAGGHTFTFEPGPFDEEIHAQQVYFPLETGLANLGWRLTLWTKNAAFYFVVNAEGNGEVLFRKNLTESQTQSATYVVYDDDSPAPLSPSQATPGSGIQGVGIPPSTITLISELPAFNNLGWITDGGNTTTGNNVDAGLDIDGTNGIDANGRAVGTDRVFAFSYNPPPLGNDAPAGADYRKGIVTDLFFWSNRYHDLLYQYGFTEAARNFQGSNFGRGGAGNDYVRAEAQDSSGTNNANFSAPPDGSLPRMQMYIFTGPNPDRDGDLDHDIVIHELTHGTSNRLHNNSTGLGTTNARGLGEGWSDFYARALLSSADENVNGVYPAGPYATLNVATNFSNNYYYGIRRFPYAVKTNLGANGKPHNPLTFADADPLQISLTDGAFVRGPIGSATANEVHNLGEIWCMALLEVRARMITRLGYAAGNARALQLVTDGMKLDPANPDFISGRNSLLAADCAGFGGADELDIWGGFAARGMGDGARYNTSTAVTESFAMPNLNVGNVTFTDAGPLACNNNGAADPGETVTLAVPLTNPFCATAASNVTLNTVGGGSASYGAINPGATATQTVNFTVPANAICGALLTVTVTINSGLGPVTRTFTLNVGQALVTNSQNFDSVSAPALPSGWASSVSGSGANWATFSSNADSTPNAAFTPNQSTTGESVLTSPAFLINNAGSRLVFRQRYSLESGFDGGVLEIKIGSGAFTDILAAHGSFLQGGYIQTLATDSSCANPLAGRSAWTGDSGGYFTTTVVLPAAAAGQNVQFRWRTGFDCGVANSGWWIDSVSIVGSVLCTSCVVQCNFTLNATSQNFLPVGGIGNIAVTASATSCNWAAVSNDSWINITSGATGTGTGATVFTVDANLNGPPRTGTLTVAGQTFTVTQGSNCNYALTPANQTIAAAGGNSSFNVQTSAGCTWPVVSNAAWLTISGTANGVGNGTVNFTAVPNPSPQRTGTITVAGQTFTVTQADGCTFNITPTSQAIAASGANGVINVTAGVGCVWTAASNSNWINITSGVNGTGNGTVGFSVAANTGPARTGTLTIAGQTFTINQADGCTFALAPTGQAFARAGGSGTVTLTAGVGCVWTATSNDNWITLTGSLSGNGNSTLTYDVTANPGATSRTGTLTIGGQTFTVSQAGSRVAKADFDGDGKTDLSTWRDSNGIWYTMSSASNALQTQPWGAGYAPYFDSIVPGDYDGDGKADHAIWRGQDSLWYIRKSSDGQAVTQLWGANYAPYFDIPVPGDYDGDGKTDIAVWRRDGTWYVKRSSDGSNLIQVHGQNGDIPVPADYDGDGQTDLAIFRPTVLAPTPNWLIINSSTNTPTNMLWGAGYAPYFDTPVPADYDGDSKADLAIWRGQDSIWYIRKSSDATFQLELWGANYAPYFDVPVPGDYDGDGKTDIAVWRRNGTWYVKRSSNGSFLVQAQGQSGDVPIPKW